MDLRTTLSASEELAEACLKREARESKAYWPAQHHTGETNRTVQPGVLNQQTPEYQEFSWLYFIFSFFYYQPEECASLESEGVVKTVFFLYRNLCYYKLKVRYNYLYVQLSGKTTLTQPVK